MDDEWYAEDIDQLLDGTSSSHPSVLRCVCDNLRIMKGREGGTPIRRS